MRRELTVVVVVMALTGLVALGIGVAGRAREGGSPVVERDLVGLTVAEALEELEAAGISNVELRPRAEPVGPEWIVVGAWPTPEMRFPAGVGPLLNAVLIAEPTG